MHGQQNIYLKKIQVTVANLQLQLLLVCCVKTVQFNKFVTCTQRDGNNQIHVQMYLCVVFIPT